VCALEWLMAGWRQGPAGGLRVVVGRQVHGYPGWMGVWRARCTVNTWAGSRYGSSST
jgi:hypothetical protein